jgi:hypoxanthine phosphoribosyltransferase
MREMKVRMRVEPVSVSSYPGTSTKSKGCTFRLPPTDLLKGMNVLIVDDIYDSGNTMKFLIEEIASIGAACIKTCVLLVKPRPDLPDREDLVDFVGFDIPGRFVIGYGLDYNELYRNLSDIGILSDKVRGMP